VELPRRRCSPRVLLKVEADALEDRESSQTPSPKIIMNETLIGVDEINCKLASSNATQI